MHNEKDPLSNNCVCTITHTLRRVGNSATRFHAGQAALELLRLRRNYCTTYCASATCIAQIIDTAGLCCWLTSDSLTSVDYRTRSPAPQNCSKSPSQSSSPLCGIINHVEGAYAYCRLLVSDLEGLHRSIKAPRTSPRAHCFTAVLLCLLRSSEYPAPRSPCWHSQEPPALRALRSHPKL